MTMGHGLTHLAPKALISALADAALFADAKGREIGRAHV